MNFVPERVMAFIKKLNEAVLAIEEDISLSEMKKQKAN